MKILFITDNFPPEVNAPATRSFEHCVEWVKQGAEVTVLTCFPNFPMGKVYKGYKNRLLKSEQMEGIQVIRLWSYIAENKGFGKRTADYISFSISAFFVGLFCKTDVVIATSPQFFTTISAFGISLFKRRPWIFELRDLWPESINTVGALKNKQLLNLLEKMELYLYRKAKTIIPVTFSFKDNLVSRGIDERKIHVIPNGCNTKLFYPREKNDTLLDQLNIKDKFIISYIGTHGMAHSLDFIISSIKDCPKEMFFLFIGDGAMKRNIMTQAKNLNLRNVLFLDSVEKEKIPHYLSITDVCLVPLIKSDTFKTVIPSKIFEAAAMGKPILLGVEGEAKGIIEKYNCGLCFEPENKTDFLEKISLLYSDKERYKQLETSSEKLTRDFNRTELAKKMLQIIRETI